MLAEEQGTSLGNLQVSHFFLFSNPAQQTSKLKPKSKSKPKPKPKRLTDSDHSKAGTPNLFFFFVRKILSRTATYVPNSSVELFPRLVASRGIVINQFQSSVGRGVVDF